MPNERDIVRIEQVLTGVTRLGGDKERTSIVSNLEITDASPTNLPTYVIIEDERDGDNILAKKVNDTIYTTGDLVNVLFIEGTEPIAFQQGSESPSAGMWGIVPSTSTDIFYNSGDVGIGKSVAPDATLEILDTSQAQLRLTHTEDTKFVDFTLNTNHDLTIKPSSTGQVIFQPTTDSTDFFQVLDADGGTPVLNVDSTNERVGIGIAASTAKFQIVGAADEVQTIIRGNATQTSNLVELQNSGSTTLIFVNGVGKFDQTITLSTPTAFTVAHNQAITFAAGAAAITNTQRGMSFVSNATGSGGGAGNIIGVIGEAQSTQSAGTITSFTAISAAVRIAGAGSATTGFGVRTIPILSSSGNLTTWRGVECRSPSVSGAGTITNLYGLYVENQTVGATLNYAIFTNDGIVFLKDRVSVGGVAAPLAQLHVDQASTVAAIPVAIFDQADVSEEMFEFITTIGVGNAIEAVGAKTLTTTHFIKVTIPGGLTRYFPVGTIA